MQISSNCTSQKQNMLQKALKKPQQTTNKIKPQKTQVKAEMRND